MSSEHSSPDQDDEPGGSIVAALLAMLALCLLAVGFLRLVMFFGGIVA